MLYEFSRNTQKTHTKHKQTQLEKKKPVLEKVELTELREKTVQLSVQ